MSKTDDDTMTSRVSPTPGYSNSPPDGSGSHSRSSSANSDKRERVRGSTLTYHKLNYSVKVTGKCCQKSDKQILHGLDGKFSIGMNAIMGPTGSGKTTLLDVLAGRTEQDGIDGHILIDGTNPPKNYKCMTGYVVQDDVVMGTLTVRENFMFSANLRLSNKEVSHRRKVKKVEETLQELGLTACADTKVGTEFIRGVSGGERKRTNIGMELIISPAVLFLDEPTTGLDASTANAVMSLLHSLSRKGRTIIFSIHQPRYAIFKLFDRLTLLAAGRTAYHGPAEDALHHFGTIGYICEEHDNPSDFFLDVINGDSTAVQSTKQTQGTRNDVAKVSDSTNHAGTNGKVSNGDVEMNVIVSEVKTLSEALNKLYLESDTYKQLKGEIDPTLDEFLKNKEAGTVRQAESIKYATSFFTQFRYVSGRTILNLIRNPFATLLQVFIAIFMAVIIGVIYLQLGFDYPAGVQNRIGVLFFVIQNQVFSNMSGVELFIKERAVFIHESASGFYRCSAYFFAKVTCDFIPIRLIPLIAFSIITYFMIGLQMDVSKFFIYFLTLYLVTMCGAAIIFAVSASVGVFAIANLLCILVFIMMLIFGGLLVNIASLPEWLRWLQYLSVFRYGLNMLSINELEGLNFTNTIKLPNSNLTTPIVITGTEYLTSQGIAHETLWDIWQNVMALGIMAIGIMFIAYVQLRRIKKLK